MIQKSPGISGIGVDIETISRFRALPYATNKRFYDNLFCPNEILYCMSEADPYPHLAVRFCAKEAFIKALGRTIDFCEIEVAIDASKKPYIIWKHRNYLLSLSHNHDSAIAFVIITP